MYYDQLGFDARLEWGIEGVLRLGPRSDVLVIVDVLSFSTAVDIAVGRGARVLPFRWRDERAIGYARDAGALLAGSMRQPTVDEPYTLSPSSLTTIPPGTLLVLPSPNGSSLSKTAADLGTAVFAGCLRNATAVATAARSVGSVVTVIAAGERWDDGESLRPAVEDLLGAGAILSALDATAPSPEAQAAMAAFAAAVPDLARQLSESASGRELIERGFAADVALAAELGVSRSAPFLRDHAFIDLAV
ncbi:MAG TPA: 2-phosphosulfolactate phosphatase [Thermomicrobiales bacterium]|nr:2-phosphosulfolactate phosphatase [Thermomicrobiales bacterium]